MSQSPLSPPENRTLVFADGASSGNPGPGGWASLIVNHRGQVVELGGREVPTTNNRMELKAVIQGLDWILKHSDVHSQNQPVSVYTDSTYVIRGITQWIWGWRKRNWTTAEGQTVLNKDLWQSLSELSSQFEVEWHYVRGHSGIPGNERVDQIAVAFSRGERPKLFLGSLLQYDVPVYDIPEKTELPEMRSKEIAKKSTPYSYLSLVDNQVMRHATWKECEQRVKGRSGAKFKKAMSPQEEASILKSWGFNRYKTT